MGEAQTKLSRYTSRYSPKKFVTAAQYILELICEHKAHAEERDLPIQFWNLPEWEKYYKTQLRKCHALLKKYDEKAIIGALKDKAGCKIYSLHAKWLEPIIQAHQKDVENKEKIEKTSIQTPVNRQTINSGLRTRPKTKNVVSILKDLDNSQE